MSDGLVEKMGKLKTMNITHYKSSFPKLCSLTLLLVTLSACNSPDTTPDADSDNTISEITISKSSVLLAGVSESIQLTAHAVNSSGETIDTPIQWRSDKPNEIAVDEHGVVTSFVVLGNASITAFQGDVESTSISVIVATFAPDIKFVEEGSIVSSPQLIDVQQPPSVDNPLIVSLHKTSSVAIGDKLMATGADFFGGEVVAIETLADELRVTLVMLPLSELFDHLKVNEVIKLNNLENHVKPEVAELYNIKILADGSIEFRLKPEARQQRDQVRLATTDGSIEFGLKPEAKKQRAQVRFAAKASTYSLGAFECLYEGAGSVQPVSINITPDHFVINHDINLLFDYDLNTIGLKKLVVDGVFEAGLHYDVKVLAQLDGFAECEIELFDIQPSLHDLFKSVMPLTIPLSAGFRVDGKMEAIAGTLQTSGSISSSVLMGIECNEVGCNTLFNTDNSADFRFDYQLSTQEQLADTFKSELRYMPYATVGFRFWGFNFSSLRVGLAETHKMGLPQTSIKDETYEAEYYLSTEIGFIPGQKHNVIWDGLKFLGISKHSDEINVEESLESTIISRSPIGSRVLVNKVGEWGSNPVNNQLQFDVSIVPTTENYHQFPQNSSSSIDTYNIKEIVIIRVADPDEFTLSMDEIARVEAQPGQTEFTIDTFGEFDMVDPAVRYYAFALTQAGVKITDPSGSPESVEYVLLGKAGLTNSIELLSVEYHFASSSHDNDSNTCNPRHSFTNFHELLDTLDIDRSIVRNSTYTTTTDIAGKASTNTTSTLLIDATAETTEFKLDLIAELESVPLSSGQAINAADVRLNFSVLNGPLSCKLSGSVNGGYRARIDINTATYNFDVDGVLYEQAIDLVEGENNITISVSALAYAGVTLNADSNISILCNAPLTVLDPEPVSSDDSFLQEYCPIATPNPGGGGGPV